MDTLAHQTKKLRFCFFFFPHPVITIIIPILQNIGSQWASLCSVGISYLHFLHNNDETRYYRALVQTLARTNHDD